MAPAVTPEDFHALASGAIVCRLPDLGILRIEGPDAATFLHGQLSSDVAGLEPGSLQRSTYNSPKGRVLADLVVWRHADEPTRFDVLLAADLAGPIAKRLAMFVLRARVSVRERTREEVLVGVAGPAAPGAITAAFGAAPATGTVAVHADAAVAALPQDGFVVIGAFALDALARHARTVDPLVWQAARVRSGVPLVTAATTDQFVPQALNLDALGGVSFQKGCYPGQEIVARTQYLGRLKERLYAFRVALAPPAPGTRLFAPSFGDQACGTVIVAAPAADAGASDLLAVVQRSAAENEIVTLGAPDGVALTRGTLPYPVPDPAPPRGRVAVPR